MKSFLPFLVLPFLLLSCQSNSKFQNRPAERNFQSSWSGESVKRPWAGADYWLNPLQAWQQKDGKMYCEVSGGDRNIALLTREITDKSAPFTMSVNLEQLPNDALQLEKIPAGLHDIGWVGFQIGLKGQFKDYRDDVIKGRGLCAGITTDGLLFIGDLSKGNSIESDFSGVGNLRLEAQPMAGTETYQLTLIYQEKGNSATNFSTTVHASWLPGQMALTCSQSIPDTLDYTQIKPPYNDLQDLSKRVGGNTRFAFSDWQISGDKIAAYSDRTYGPILWTQHTLSNDIMKMSAQFVPVGDDNREVSLSLDGSVVQNTTIDKEGNNALFRIENWDSSKAHDYVVSYKNRKGETITYKGTIRKEPTGKLKLAALSCVDDRGFPHQDLVDNVTAHRPDMLSFHGDQLYERVGGYGVERNSKLDYLRKWYIFGWSFRDLLRDIPSVIIPDDHDVFHGNLWGEGGKAADVTFGYGYDAQDSGGYKEPADFVNMVHRTQTGHLPDPYDGTPVMQDISVYYTNMNYGGVSFAILGDRQWKSAPKPLFPEAAIENGWPQNKQWNPKTDAFHPQAELLGSRQERFLENWVTDWSSSITLKAVISQSPFCNVATLPADIWHDKYVPGLPRYRKGEYPLDDRPVADFDSNGWPQNKRDKAIRTIRKAFALHITGDQHLGSTGRYGVDAYEDGGYWISSPAVANLWPRRWFPAQEADGGKAADDTRRYTGNYEDGFGNKITVAAIANPYDIDREPAMVYDKAPGYAIVEFDIEKREIKLAVWPRWATVGTGKTDNQPFDGWPVNITQTDNFGKRIAGFLREVTVNGKEVVQIINEENGELIYNLIPPPGSFRPFIFQEDVRYTIRKIVDNKIIQEIENLNPEQ